MCDEQRREQRRVKFYQNIALTLQLHQHRYLYIHSPSTVQNSTFLVTTLTIDSAKRNEEYNKFGEDFFK